MQNFLSSACSNLLFFHFMSACSPSNNRGLLLLSEFATFCHETDTGTYRAVSCSCPDVCLFFLLFPVFLLAMHNMVRHIYEVPPRLYFTFSSKQPHQQLQQRHVWEYSHSCTGFCFFVMLLYCISLLLKHTGGKHKLAVNQLIPPHNTLYGYRFRLRKKSCHINL